MQEWLAISRHKEELSRLAAQPLLIRIHVHPNKRRCFTVAFNARFAASKVIGVFCNLADSNGGEVLRPESKAYAQPDQGLSTQVRRSK